MSQKSQILFRLNLDARSVPEALVNSFRLLTPLPTRLNPPDPEIPFKKKIASDFWPGTQIIESAVPQAAPGTPPELLGRLLRRFSKICVGTAVSVGAEPNAKCFSYSEIQSITPLFSGVYNKRT